MIDRAENRVNVMDGDILRVVASDLKFLDENWDQDISDDSLRQSSNLLRMLLVDGNLLKAWQGVGLDGQPRISAPTLQPLLQLFRPEEILIAQAGGARFKGTIVRPSVQFTSIPNGEQIKKYYELGPDVHVACYELTKFIESPCIIVKGIKVNRRELIEYVANKLGGTHFDPRRDRTNAKEQKFLQLDELWWVRVADKNCIYYELLSVGQSIVCSDDIRMLREKLSALGGKQK